MYKMEMIIESISQTYCDVSVRNDAPEAIRIVPGIW